MSDRVLRVVAVVLAAGGAAVMAYLLYVRHAGGAPICAGDGCAAVQQSRYAEIFGVPVAALGLAGFAAIGAASAVADPRGGTVQAFLVLSALGFSAYLLVVQLAVIGAVCEWCVFGDVLLALLAAVVLLRLRERRPGGLSPPGRASV